MCNEDLVEAETRQYWWGRGVGCAFFESSCFEILLNASLSANPRYDEYLGEEAYAEEEEFVSTKMEEGPRDTFLLHSDQNALPLPFCDDRDLFFELALEAPKKVCLSNATVEKSFIVHCQIVKKLKVTPKHFEVVNV